VQVDELAQLMDASGVDPSGVPRSLQSEPPSVVPIRCGPVAKHVVSLGQAMPVSVLAAAGGVCGTHVAPPFAVKRTTALGPPDDTPTAVQCSASGQEMPEKFVTMPGYGSAVHEAPLLLVARMLGDELPKSLTA